MPRPRPPPTPSGSTDLKGLEKALQPSDMETTFTLPPPALRQSEAQTHHYHSKSANRDSSTATFAQSTPPVSPRDKPLSSSPRSKRTASGVVKSAAESASSNPYSSSYALPPPPSRARKIIQMKPKSTSANNSSPASDASYQPPASAVSAPALAPKSAATSTNAKRKQPSATSAAGRKIARKTAHSIIERRRRSKMNEEFGVLKDMIPACEGVEMHKLAILQAGIEYVRYLEGCVAQLKAENDKKGKTNVSRMQIDEQEDEDDDEDDDEDEDMDPEPRPPAKMRTSRHAAAPAGDWTLRDSRKSSVASLSSSSNPSPNLQSQGQMDDQGNLRKVPILPAGMGPYTASPSQMSVQSNISSSTPTPTLLSPAFKSIHFSPDHIRSQTSGSTVKSVGGSSLNLNPPSSSGSWTTVNPNSNPSPNMQPLPSPKASMHLPLPQPPSLPPSGGTLQRPQPYSAAQRERDAHSKSPATLSDGSGTAEATAGAVLMMLTNEWRGAGREQAPGSSSANRNRDSRDRGKGMSVRDLLSS